MNQTTHNIRFLIEIKINAIWTYNLTNIFFIVLLANCHPTIGSLSCHFLNILFWCILSQLDKNQSFEDDTPPLHILFCSIFSSLWKCFVATKNNQLSLAIIRTPVTDNLILPFFSPNYFEWFKFTFKTKFQIL